MLGHPPVDAPATGALVRLSPARVRAALKVADGLAIVGTAWVARGFVAQAADGPLFWFATACAALVGLDLFAAAGLYRPRALGRTASQIGYACGAWLGLQALMVLFTFVSGSLGQLPLAFFLAWSAIALPTLAVVHGTAALMFARGRRAGWLATRVFLVGAGPQAAAFIQRIRRHDPGIVVAGLFDDRQSRVPAEVEGHPVRGTLEELARVARAEPVDQIVITLPQHAAARRLDCFEKLRHLPVDVRLSPDLPDLGVEGQGVTELAGMPLLRVFDRPLAGWSRLAKLLEDRLLALLILVLTAPLMLSIALAVRLTSPGPILYRQRRYGFDNRSIEVLKFRTMHLPAAGAEDAGPISTRRGDPRVTAIGRLLRRTSLDELPQFLNVLLGQMSIVGPRPHAVAHNERFASLIDGYLARHRVKPGITGWAQIHGLRGEAETLARMQERVRYDLHYIENWSILLDLRIIFRTLLVGFSHPNAY
ncbi:MAG: undecaprenyl-phosphate glucose phosphotransferase [Geminicoccaceae bacterium]